MNIKIDDLLNELNAIKYVGLTKPSITELVDLLSEDEIFSHQLFWCNQKNAERLERLSGGNAIVSEETASLVTYNPRSNFKKVLELYFTKKVALGYIAKSASISSTATCAKDVFVGENVVIEDNCKIGSKVIIGSNTVILAGTIIKNNVTIGCNNTIGGVGFGYEKNEAGEWEVIPHIGNVVIEEGVEIGNGKYAYR
jgi:UDP-3-O-[3-hydroxymyristoyl] glucosamine N-acyltransferase